MQYVKFNIDQYRYVLPVVDMVEIIPYVKLKKSSKLLEYIAGQCSYRGILVPVIDLCSLIIKKPCKKKLSTRILIIAVTETNSTDKMVGLMVEKATEIVKVEEDSFMDAGIYKKDLPYVGPVISDSSGLISRIYISEILSRVDYKNLFSAPVKTA